MNGWGRLLAPVLLLWLTGPSGVQAAEQAQPGSEAGAGPGPEITVELFTQEGCPRCVAAKIFLAELRRERPDVHIVVHALGTDAAALARLKALAFQKGIRTPGVPAFFLRGELIIGFTGAETTGRRIRSLLAEPIAGAGREPPEGACRLETTAACDQPTGAPGSPAPDREGVDAPFFGRLNAGEMGLPAFTLALGLLDGFNPCAMWVLLFLLSLLVNLRDRTKMALLAGTFVAVSGMVYYAFMAAWLNVFLLVGFSRAVQVALGGIACLVGAFNLKDVVAFGRGPSLHIPESAKPGLYAQVRRILQADNVAGALAAVVALAVMVNVVELLCTAGFPAVYTQILTLRQLPRWEYYAYLGLYNLAYVLDDGLMVAVAVATLGRSKLQERAGRWLKLAGGAVMLGLGVVLLAKPEWLAG